MTAVRLLCAAAVLTLALPVAASPASEAAAHLSRGSRLYNEGHYDDAVRELEAGYALDARPDFLYALGQAERKRGDCAAAIKWYQRYVDTGPSSQRTVATLMQIDRCKQELATARPTSPSPQAEPAAPPATTTTPEPPSSQETSPSPSPQTSSPVVAAAPPSSPAAERTPLYKRWWLWTAVVGVAVVGAGVGVGIWLAERPSFNSTLPDLSWSALKVHF